MPSHSGSGWRAGADERGGATSAFAHDLALTVRSPRHSPTPVWGGEGSQGPVGLRVHGALSRPSSPGSRGVGRAPRRDLRPMAAALPPAHHGPYVAARGGRPVGSGEAAEGECPHRSPGHHVPRRRPRDAFLGLRLARGRTWGGLGAPGADVGWTCGAPGAAPSPAPRPVWARSPRRDLRPMARGLRRRHHRWVPPGHDRPQISPAIAVGTDRMGRGLRDLAGRNGAVGEPAFSGGDRRHRSGAVPCLPPDEPTGPGW